MFPVGDLRDRPLFPGARGPALVAAAAVLVPLYVMLEVAARTGAEALGLAGVIVAWMTAGLVVRSRGSSWADLGLRRSKFREGVRIALPSTVVLLLVSSGSSWLLRLFTGWEPDLADFEILRGNPTALATGLMVVWTTAAFGEEMIYRAFLLRALRDAFGGGWAAPLVVSSVLFGLAHSYQDLAGVVLTGLVGACLGVIYLRSGRNLWAAVLTHGFYDTVGFLLVFMGWERFL